MLNRIYKYIFKLQLLFLFIGTKKCNTNLENRKKSMVSNINGSTNPRNEILIYNFCFSIYISIIIIIIIII